MNYLRVIGATIILAVSVLTLAACQEPASPLEDYHWVLLRYGAPGNINKVLPGTEVTAFFDSQEKTVSGSGGCNIYSGSYQSEKLTLSFPGPLAITERACGAAINEQEARYMEILQAANRFRMDHGNLIIYSGDTMLFFQRTDSPPNAIGQWGE